METPDQIKKGLEDLKFIANAGRIDDALALIQQLESRVPRWISVKERLPEYGYNVPVIYAGGYIGMAQWSGWGWYKLIYRESHIVTHWMPLPEPPKEA